MVSIYIVTWKEINYEAWASIKFKVQYYKVGSDWHQISLTYSISTRGPAHHLPNLVKSGMLISSSYLYLKKDNKRINQQQGQSSSYLIAHSNA